MRYNEPEINFRMSDAPRKTLGEATLFPLDEELMNSWSFSSQQGKADVLSLCEFSPTFPRKIGGVDESREHDYKYKSESALKYDAAWKEGKLFGMHIHEFTEIVKDDATKIKQNYYQIGTISENRGDRKHDLQSKSNSTRVVKLSESESAGEGIACFLPPFNPCSEGYEKLLLSPYQESENGGDRECKSNPDIVSTNMRDESKWHSQEIREAQMSLQTNASIGKNIGDMHILQLGKQGNPNLKFRIHTETYVPTTAPTRPFHSFELSVGAFNSADQPHLFPFALKPQDQNLPPARSARCGLGIEKPARIAGKHCCSCKKSRCLKLYCECFAAGGYCYGCNCVECHNQAEHEDEIREINQTLNEKNPSALKRRLNEENEEKLPVACNCTKSECLKKYCECYKKGLKCNSRCNCTSCKNAMAFHTISDKRQQKRSNKLGSLTNP